MSELVEFKKVVSPIAYGLAYKSELGTTEYQQLYAEEEVIKYFNNKPSLTISKSIADELKDAIGATNFESTPYSVNLDEDGYLKMWASLRHKKLSDKTYKFCRDNTRVFDAYLNPLTRDLVKVVEG